VINFSAGGSSVAKGESLKDTALTLQAMGADAIVVRHSSSGSPLQLTRWVDAHVLNAGDGTHEHPTQALLDLYTMREKHGRLDGLRVAIVGDVLHSRVARSLIHGLTTLGVPEVRVIGPQTLMPAGVEALGVKVFHDMKAGLKDADVIVMLRLQNERMRGALLPSAQEFFKHYGLTADKLSLARKDAIVMHPGPMNRGVEIDSSVADGKNSVILPQVTFGIAVRMAVMSIVAGN
jgi:aspartate carbamoyltransferase catalytic subunit